MFLKLLDGPMDGAIYELGVQCTNRKPDKLSFLFQEESSGRWGHEEYEFDRLAPSGDHVTMIYKYTGQVIDTGIEMETAQRPTVPDEVAENVRLTPRQKREQE